MSLTSTRSLTVRGQAAEVFAALREAARRTGFQLVSSDAAAGTARFTSARVMLNFGEKLTVRLVEVAPGTVEVTLSSDRRTTFAGSSGGRDGGADRMAAALSELLPPAG